MKAILTNETAISYMTTLLASYGDGYHGVTVTSVGPSVEIGDAGIDVEFTYADNLTGNMTVWVERDGSLYGEW